VLVCSERRVLVAGGWFVLREKYCWLVADEPSEQGDGLTARSINPAVVANPMTLKKWMV
jgi:hypothetical protein